MARVLYVNVEEVLRCMHAHACMASAAATGMIHSIGVAIACALAAPSFPNGTAAIWSMWSSKNTTARHVLLRPLTLQTTATTTTTGAGSVAPPVSLRVRVAAAPDSSSQGKILALYRLYVNGRVAGIGPGRGDGPLQPLVEPAAQCTMRSPCRSGGRGEAGVEQQ